MNQILYIGKTNGKKQKTSTTLDLNVILKFFCIAIIVFGIAFIGSGSYTLAQNLQIKIGSDVSGLPVAKIEKMEDNNIKITATHTKKIEKIVYNWNNVENIEIDGKGRKYIEEVISLPSGNNILNVTIRDVEGNEAKYMKEYIADSGDTDKPKIDLVLTGTTLNITAADNTEMSYITYRWNEEEEVKIEASGTDKTKISIDITILKGENTLTIVAVDNSNNTQTKIQKFEGVTKPVIKVSANDTSLEVIITHEKGINKVEFEYNGQTGYLADDMLGEQTVVFSLPLIEGENRLKITAYSTEGTEQTFDGICNN